MSLSTDSAADLSEVGLGSAELAASIGVDR